MRRRVHVDTSATLETVSSQKSDVRSQTGKGVRAKELKWIVRARYLGAGCRRVCNGSNSRGRVHRVTSATLERITCNVGSQKIR